MDIFNFSHCNIAQVIGESQRFIFHVFFLHIYSFFLDSEQLFSDSFFKTIVKTFLSILTYHLFIRKVIEPKIKKIKLICLKNKLIEEKQIKIKKNNKVKNKHKKIKL